MLELHTWGTTNGRRPIIMLEETGLAYKLIPVDIKSGANKSPEHLAISPYGKIPALVDTDAGGKRASVFESTAIVQYLGEKTGKLIGSTPAGRADVTKWFIFGVANILPTFATMRTHKDLEEVAVKLLDVQEKQLANSEYLAGGLFDRGPHPDHAPGPVRRPRVDEDAAQRQALDRCVEEPSLRQEGAGDEDRVRVGCQGMA